MILFSKGGISMFQLTSPKKQKAFTLVELLTVMVVLVALATITVKSTAQFSFDSRYQITEDRYDKIKTAILGNPNQTINGHPSVSGFVADMGRLPNCLRELIDGYNCAATVSPFFDTGFCSDGSNSSQADCLSPATWTNTLYQIDKSYCSDSTKTTQATCISPAVWITGYCTNTTTNTVDTSKNTASLCTPPTYAWTAYSGLGYGWRGSYIETSNAPAKANSFVDGWGRTAQGVCYNAGIPIVNHTDSANCIAADATNIWNPANDFNYGWYFWNNINANELTVLSYGKNQIYDNPTPPEQYDTDFPETHAPAINANDWGYPLSTLVINVESSQLLTTPPTTATTATCIDTNPIIATCPAPNTHITITVQCPTPLATPPTFATIQCPTTTANVCLTLYYRDGNAIKSIVQNGTQTGVSAPYMYTFNNFVQSTPSILPFGELAFTIVGGTAIGTPASCPPSSAIPRKVVVLPNQTLDFTW
jgi:prepilin-type N-terminal cleavage/methylation domain-containing protein